MWGGRFKTAPSELMQAINASIDIDKRLYAHDIKGSLAHVAMLADCSIIKNEEAALIAKGLHQIQEEIEKGAFPFREDLEDIHMNIEARLHEIIGDIAGKMHTARSRNDQVATAFRLWMKDAIAEIMAQLTGLADTISKQASIHEHSIMPGFTHLQIAQPVTVARHLGAWQQMLSRDRLRFGGCLDRLDYCPLGAAALAGTSFPINRAQTAEALGFKAPIGNTMDAVSSRDFVLEFLSASAICASHLSRFAEELILWSSAQFGYVTLSDDFTTGSSIMPQKKNPDAAELIRGKSGQITGLLMQMLMVMKALPLSYNKDMQEDKEAVFKAFDTLSLCLSAMCGMIGSLSFHTEKMKTDAGNGYSTATDLADWLVKELGLPFRKAHHITGQLVRAAELRRCKLDELELVDMQAVEPRITKAIYKVLDVESAVRQRQT